MTTTKRSEDCPSLDQRRELLIGGGTWWACPGSPESIILCELTNGRGGLSAGGDTSWGDWAGDVLTLDDLDADGCAIQYGRDGQEVPRD